MGITNSVDGTLQTIGGAYIWLRIVAAVLLGVGLVLGGVYSQVQYRKHQNGDNESKHLVTGTECEMEYECQDIHKSGEPLRQMCTVCAVSGKFGELHHTYKRGAEPRVNTMVVVYKTRSGELALEPDAPIAFHALLYITGAICLVSAGVMFALRTNKWNRRVHGVGAGVRVGRMAFV
jgi:hypothetical protein